MPLENWRYTIPLRLRSIFRRNRVEQELQEEMACHLDLRIRQEMDRGASEKDARVAALRAMDGMTFHQEQCRDARRIRFIETLLQDLRYALRQLRLSPGFTVVAVLSLALGIGANTAIFQLFDAVSLRNLPVSRPQELYKIDMGDQAMRGGRSDSRSARLTYALWEEVAARQQAFTGVFAWSATRFNLAPAGEVRFAEGLYVSGGLFRSLGVAPALGRLFTTADDQTNCGNPGAVLSYAFWQRDFAGDPRALDRKVTLDGRSFPVIGVTAPRFFGLEVGHRFDVAIPLCADTLMADDHQGRIPVRSAWWLSMMGRLKPGWTEARANAHLQAISPGIMQATVPSSYRPGWARSYLANRFGAEQAGGGLSGLRAQYEEPLVLLLAATGLVLLIACANLANLLLARGGAREREIAVRLAIGSSRIRLVRQFLTESLLLAVLGASVGVLLAQTMSRSLVAFLSTANDPVFVALPLDAKVLGFTAVVAVATCLLFGLTPALRATQIAPGDALRAGGRSIMSAGRRLGVRRVLVATQVALSLVLLFGALLFAGSLRKLMTVNPGFRPEGVLSADLDFTALHYNDARCTELRRSLLDRLSARPNITSMAEVAIMPLSGSGWADEVRLPSYGLGQRGKNSMFNRVGPGYFRTLGTQLIAGRDFDSRDTLSAPPVAIVNQAFARTIFDGANPIGRVFAQQKDKGHPDVVYRVVGLVADSKYYNLREDPKPIAYLAAGQMEEAAQGASYVLRSTAPAGDSIRTVAAAISEVNPAIQYQFHVLAGDMSESALRERLMAALSGAFGLLAGLLAALGIYGVMSFMVARRKNEIGVRIALGAKRGRVVTLVLREALQLVAAGLAAGAALAVWAGRAAANLLFGIRPSDPGLILASILLLASVAIAAAWLPARRAASMDPMSALRQD